MSGAATSPVYLKVEIEKTIGIQKRRQKIHSEEDFSPSHDTQAPDGAIVPEILCKNPQVHRTPSQEAVYPAASTARNSERHFAAHATDPNPRANRDGRIRRIPAP